MTTNTAPASPPSRQDARQVLNTLTRTLNFNDTDIAKAGFANSLPMGARIIDVMVEIVTAFNAGTTNPITVGTNSATYNNIVASGDITPGVAGVSMVMRGQGRSLTAAAEVPVFATYVPTGTAATTGVAVITITYDGGFTS